jgi:hypothetical protein
MKNTLFAFMITAAFAVTASAATITVLPNPVTVGSQVTLELNQLIGEDDFATAYGFNLGIDNGLLSLVSVTIDPAWVPGTPVEGDPMQVGTSDNFLGVAGPNIHLATFVYTALAAGVTRFSITSNPGPNNLNDGLYTLNNEGALNLSTFVDVTVQDVSGVPEPSTLGMMLLGVGALAARRRRR